MSERCSKRVWDSFSRRSHQCENAAKYEVDGQHYCGTHNPEAAARRRQKANDRWNAKHEASVAAANKRKQDEVDARRYRWLRDMPSRTAEISVGAIANEGPCMLQRESLDAAIDAAMKDDPRYTLTDLGKAYRDAMQRGAKLNGGVKAGEGGE